MTERKGSRFNGTLRERLESVTPDNVIVADFTKKRNPRPSKFGVFQRQGGGVWLVKSGLDPNKHKLFRLDAWAVDEWLYQELIQRGGRGVRLELVAGDTLTSSLSDWEEHGEVFEHEGWGSQRALHSRFWRKSSPLRPTPPAGASLPTSPSGPTPLPPVQLGLRGLAA